MEVTFVRHGKTLWNASRRFQGQTDVPLSNEGRAQARALARRLHDASFDRAYASDLGRAMETARTIVAARGIEITPDERLREFDFGAWEGLTWDEIVATRPHLQAHGSTAAKLYAPEGGESFAEVCARVGAFLNELRRRELRRVLVVAHAGPLHAMLRALELTTGDERDEHLSASFAPAGITRVTMNAGSARLITLNDVSHLDSPL